MGDHPNDGADGKTPPAKDDTIDNTRMVYGMVFGMLAGTVIFMLTDNVLFLTMGMMVGLVAGLVFPGSRGSRDGQGQNDSES